MNQLIQQVSRLTEIDPQTMRAVQREVLSIESEWTSVYSDYHTGGWHTLSLLNSTRKATDTIIEDCEPVETDLLLEMPATRALLRQLGFHYMWVRLAKLEPGTFFWEHRDYQELEKVNRFRIHMPVVTNESAYLILNGAKINLPVGHLWKLDPVHRHGACNFGAEARVHMLMDCYRDETLSRHLAHETVREEWFSNLRAPSTSDITCALARARALALQGCEEEAELSLLKMFHTYGLEEGGSYDLVSQMYWSLGER
ncbi:MAG TPA: aspartyl/asparaginyl beta-hydroxylase domain-containing protein, partial [Pyrinomonadaceae bacterium]